MPTLQQQIAAKFLVRLGQSGVLDADGIEQLRVLLEGTKKPKADDFVKLFNQPVGDDIR